MTVSPNTVVSLTYELRLNSISGEMVESVDRDSPLTFIFGSGSLLPKFEDNLAGLRVGDAFDFNLNSVDAYGDFDENAVVKVPIQAFQMDGKVDESLVKVGNKIPMQDSEGHRLTGVVKSLENDAVVMDFNHPLAGNSLFFKGEVTHIRQATEEEISHGHLHGSSDCGCCSGCGDDAQSGSGCCS